MFPTTLPSSDRTDLQATRAGSTFAMFDRTPEPSAPSTVKSSLSPSLLQDLLQLQREVLAAAAQQIAQPPPPPPDYVSLGHSALAAIREIGVAMVQRGQNKDGAAKTPPLLAAPSSEEAAAQPSPRGDAIDRMVSKLRSVSDQDIALAMSAPDRWKALLDDLVSGKKEPAPSGPPSQEQTESKEEGGAP